MDTELMPREKLLIYGAEVLTDVELLAIFLRTGIKGMPVMELSEKVLNHFGSLRCLLTADVTEFCSIKGLGKTQFIQLQATREMTKRYLTQKMKAGAMVSSPRTAIILLQAMLENHEREIFVIFFLDNQNRLIKIEEMFSGTINQTAVYPREILKAIFKFNAAAILIAHNHPSGDCKPSTADRTFTKKMNELCSLVDVRFVDHIIVGKGNYFSFEEEKATSSVLEDEDV